MRCLDFCQGKGSISVPSPALTSCPSSLQGKKHHLSRPPLVVAITNGSCPAHLSSRVKFLLFGIGDIRGRAEPPLLLPPRSLWVFFFHGAGLFPARQHRTVVGKATAVMVNDQAELAGAWWLCKHVPGASPCSPLQFSGSSTPPWRSRRCRRCSAAWPPSSR